MNEHSAARPASPADNYRGLRLLALIAVVVGVLLLAGAAFLLSYSGIHAIALTTGVAPSLARLYPLIFDAMLVVACAAVLSLRGAGLIARCYAWLTTLALLTAAAWADALHATGTRLPHRPAAAAVAIFPWALVLVGFGLLLSMLRHARQRKASAAARRAEASPGLAQAAIAQAGHVQVHHGIDDLLRPELPAGGMTARQPGGQAELPADHGMDLAIDMEPGQDDPTSDEAHLASQPASVWLPRARDGRAADFDDPYRSGYPAADISPAPTADLTIGGDTGQVPSYLIAQPGPPDDRAAAPPGDRASAMPGDHTSAVPGDRAAALPAAPAADAGESQPDGPDGDPAADPAADPDAGLAAGPVSPRLPQFKRMWSPPTPPSQ